MVRSTLRDAPARLRRAGAELAGGRARPSPRPPASIAGVVEFASEKVIVGWVSTPADAPPTKVDLYVGRVKVASTFATNDDSLTGVGHIPGRENKSRLPRMKGALPGPRNDRRKSRQQIRSFSFGVRGIWHFCQPRTKVSVRADGTALPICGHGMFIQRRDADGLRPRDLRERLAEGYVLNKYGDLQLSKRFDEAWQRDVLDVYHRARSVLADKFGYDLFLIYGTLLGAVREGGLISNDDDFDAGFVSRLTDGDAVAEEFVDVALAFIEAGFEVNSPRSSLHVIDPDTGIKVDLFHTYFADDGRWRLPFGIAGTSELSRQDWEGCEEVTFLGDRVLIPGPAEEVVRHLYGDDWMLPKQGFTWPTARTESAPEAILTVEQRTKIYWANFYAHTEYAEGSSFFRFMQRYPDMPDAVIDIGCGDGRDACAFGVAGRHVIGIDQSPVGIQHAAARAVDTGVRDAEFHVCDVSDQQALTSVLSAPRDREEPTAFYLRFFLHAITAEAQEALLTTIGSCAHPDDLLAAEFRTDKDADRTKVHGNHYRRFQNADEFADDLERRGWVIEHREEETGLSPYGDEDPVLCRVVARWPG